MGHTVKPLTTSCTLQLYRGGSRNFREGFPYHSQWSSNFIAIFDGNYKFLSSTNLEKFYGQSIKIFEMEGVSGNPRNPPKTALDCMHAFQQIHTPPVNQQLPLLNNWLIMNY